MSNQEYSIFLDLSDLDHFISSEDEFEFAVLIESNLTLDQAEIRLGYYVSNHEL